MLNIFEAKYLEIAKRSPYIQSVARPGQLANLIRIEYYAYNIVVGNATTPLNFNVDVIAALELQADSDFAVAMLSGAVQQAANAALVVNRNLTVQIQDTSTGKNFFSAPTMISLIAGAGGFSYVFPAPRVIAPNTALQFTCRNRDTSLNYLNAQFTLHGTRLFYR